MLTATPIQNRIDEIFHLVSLLKPGHLGSQTNFFEKYKSGERSTKDEERLKELVNKVMIRNRRIDTGIEWTKRHVKTILIDFSKEERDLYDSIQLLKTNDQAYTRAVFL